MLLLGLSALGAAIAQHARARVSFELAAARAEHRQLLTLQQRLVRQAEDLRQRFDEKSGATVPTGPRVQPRPRA